ncbi:MAG TPA: winged helix-turn-helix domain-containing protein [Candidatus Methanomethylophilaceae archaeon]|nr:winged helix-turn-helix domain-containing protein [Candidatus Methanomethylophilaceae archaeon]
MSPNISNDFKLYYTEMGLVYVSNKLRIRILEELSKKSLSLTDLVEVTGKAQSTLSVHLDKMLKDGIINVEDDPNDNRRKTYTVGSSCLVHTKTPDPESLEKAKELFLDIANDPESIGAHMPSFMFVALDSLGLSVAPIYEGLGRIHAQALTSRLVKGTIDVVIEQLREMHSYVNLGDVTVFKFNPLTLIVKSNFRVSKGAAESFGMYARGFFCQALEIIYKIPITVVSSEVFGAENNYYSFELDYVNK